MDGDRSADRMNSEAESSADGAGQQPRTSRRGVLRAAGAASAALVAGVGAGTGVAAAQDDTGGDVTTKAAIPADTPQFDNDDYTGMFVHVAGVDDAAATADVGTCPFLGADDEVTAYDATVVDRVDADHPQADTTLYAASGNDDVSAGALFVVNNQQQCGAGTVQLRLEEIGEADVRVSEEADDAAVETPGFGVGAAVAGLFGGAAYLRRRGD
ncbi:hypothetical protein [Halobaculum sp. D14]|uniref:hypothetical protein n=1 Tax=Halobaculum sp. D14 TaxID=3421642 RepID=UPI003EBA03FE